MSIEGRILILLVLVLTLLEFVPAILDRCAIVGEKWFELCTRLQSRRKQMQGSPAPQPIDETKKVE
jgi:hypothetical protein